MANRQINFASRYAIAGCLAALLMASQGLAQDTAQDDKDRDDSLQNIVVTGTAIRQGGAQDIRHFRSVALDGDFLPATSDLTVEGLFGEHDLTLPERTPCRQTFCLTGAAMPAALPLRPADRWFVGLGFSSNIDAEAYRREPMSLIAVVDRSGSMSDEPMDHVKASLHALVGKLRPGDRIGIVTYGSEPMTHLDMIEFDGNRDRINAAIDGIEIEGSTALEAGLASGYAMAERELAHSHGKTRVMLFTDENPNVGDTSAEGFMAQAEAGSQHQIGLTTFGVGVHFDAELATKVSSVRGGNLFFIDTAGTAKELFDREFLSMVNAVAYDVEIAMTPPPGYRITGVFGVPEGNLADGAEGEVKVKIATAFLTTNGGGIFVTLGKDEEHSHLPAASLASNEPLLGVTLRYADARSGKVSDDTLTVSQPGNEEPPTALASAQLLVDEYVTLSSALDTYHDQNDKKGAFNKLDGLSKRLAASSLPGMIEERKLVGDLRDRAAYVAGYSGEMPKSLRPLALKGEWRVVSQTGLSDIERGDDVEITQDGEMITSRNSGRTRGDDITQSVKINESQLYVVDADLTFDYRLSGDRLLLATNDGASELILRRAE